MQRIFSAFRGNMLMARAARSASWIVMGYGASQIIRLASNLILTRLLFPEAFGLMTLITVVTVGLALFSDVGIGPAIAQSKRGDDQEFLDTAWSIQVIRGVCLTIVGAALAWPAAAFYEAPELTIYLPLAALGLLITGFNPTRIETATRHLLIGRVTALDILSQVIGIVAMIALALAWQSVAALVIGNLIGTLAYLVLTSFFLPGAWNRFRWEKSAGVELISFGKWIFLSTLCWFFSSQGDKLILGKFLNLTQLGIYNIGYFLGSFPLMLGLNVTGRIMIPIYRERAEQEHRLVRMRFLLTAVVWGLLMLGALIGPWAVDVLYDVRYTQAGFILSLICLALVPQVIGMSYDQAALAAGDSWRFFVFTAARSVFQMGLLYLGVLYFGLAGGLIGMGLAGLLAHGVLVWLARAHQVWDARHDILFMVLTVPMIALTYMFHSEGLLRLWGG